MTDKSRRNAITHRLGRTIIRLRREKRLTRMELAQLAGVSGAYIRMVEHGISTPTLPVVVDLALALGVTPMELVREVVEETS
jgi:transcriptional regulator with XRE-family HTH domain